MFPGEVNKNDKRSYLIVHYNAEKMGEKSVLRSVKVNEQEIKTS